MKAWTGLELTSAQEQHFWLLLLCVYIVLNVHGPVLNITE